MHMDDMDDWNDTIDDIASSQSQSTQPASQPDPIPEIIDDTWGILDSSDPLIHQHAFYKSKRSYTLGRRPFNDVVLERRLISGQHCIIRWDGKDAVTVFDKSMNGTFINGKKINGFRALKHGDQISLGSAAPSDSDAFRFKYRHTIPPTPLQLKYDQVTCPKLGQGSFGDVWKWVCRATSEPVAVKSIRDPKIIGSPSNSDPSARREQCIREADILQRFDHQNICKLKDFFLEEDPFSNNISFVSIRREWLIGTSSLRLSEYSPFVDPPDATNILSRISDREIDYLPLRRRDPTDEAVHFIKCLLKAKPDERMTSTDALEHEWFHGYMPVYDD
ncbi:hypothetical protein H0H93_003507 [Arthromyces matolae]|nr:hypothetical protein H0H93_003507 [Arthromyces matolae]